MKLRTPFFFLSACSFFFAATSLLAVDLGPAATATNEIGVDLYRKLAADGENLGLSPFSIESALAMTFVTTRRSSWLISRSQHVPSGACLFIGRITDPR